MKRTNLLILLLLLSTAQLVAQTSWKAQKRKLSSLSFTVSPFSESLSGLSQTDILGLIKDPADRMNMDGFQKASSFNTEMTGEFVNLKLGFAKEIKPFLLAELQVGLTAQTYGELILDYYKPDADETEFVGLCYMHNRIGLTAGYKLRKYSDRSSFSFGPTGTVAKTFNDLVIYMGGGSSVPTDNVEARSSTITNLHFEIDYAYRIFNNLALNVGGKYGVAYFISANNENSIGNNYSLNLGLEYQFFRK